ncbi:Serine/threonine-protein kinase HT1 [Hypsizygus marmoreus]|uniref:Serine/threonine-protein kinase HT1 n=1 Tax=Hypsizygus marmoreus TaxID=39966 RepID=A0A369K2B8_HYPMA|nr:Serine/threonine-protein kinase HT1 [Hypsizygus marmoreus]
MSAECHTLRLGDALGNFQASLSPFEQPYEWRRANIADIQATSLTAVPILTTDDVASLAELIYPRLFVYTLAHLKFCMKDDALLVSLKANQSQWSHRDPITLLMLHQYIKDSLRGFLNRFKQNHLHSFSDIEHHIKGLCRLDVIDLATRVLTLLRDEQSRKLVFIKQGSEAQALLNLFQAIVDFPGVGVVGPPILRAILELSKKSGLFPASLVLQGVQPEGTEAAASGSYGYIWKGRTGGKAVAMKVMRGDSSSTGNIFKIFCKEAILWRHLRHPHVLPFYGVCQWPGAPLRVCLVSPWMENENIVQYLQKNPHADRRALILDIARGLDYLHTFDPPMIHGDLRANNILITPALRACIADFGLCSLVRDSSLQFTPTASAFNDGNMLWLAPEFFQIEETESPRQSLATDIYSFGCVCYEVFAGRPRFSELLAIYEVIAAVTKDRRPGRPTNAELDDALWDLMNRCWSLNPDTRPTSSEIVESLLSKSFVAYTPTKELGDWDWGKASMSPLHSTLVRQSVTAQDVIIALMGPTGVGKSTFINVATQLPSVVVGDDLESCTQDIRAIPYPHPDGSGRNIVFVDTPGFDDSERTDYEILTRISDWLKQTYQEHITLTGLLFFHRIGEARMRGTPLKNLNMFEALCGKDALKNVILTTTMWDQVNPETGNKRESQLRAEFWKPMMDHGSRVARFTSTFDSAWEITSQFDINTPRAVQLQRELVDEKKDLNQTSAFMVLVRWWEQAFSRVKSRLKAKFRFVEGRWRK